MSLTESSYLVGTACFTAGALLSHVLWRWKDRSIRAAWAIKEQTILDTARREAETIAREAKVQANEEAIKLRQQTESAFTDRRARIIDAEKRMVERESLINRQLENLVEQEQSLRVQQQECRKRSDCLDQEKIEVAELVRLRREALHAASKLNEAEARTLLLKEVELEALQDASALTRRILDEAKSRAEEKARRIISVAIQRYAGEHTFETTSATLALPDEELKGRIIGREGRNIRAFEAATGVTVLIDDTPNAVVLSGFDPVRREIARESMQRLILDGRIHPTRIEEVVSKVAQEMEETIVQAGEASLIKTGLPPMHPEVVKLLGRLKFRHRTGRSRPRWSSAPQPRSIVPRRR